MGWGKGWGSPGCENKACVYIQTKEREHQQKGRMACVYIYKPKKGETSKKVERHACIYTHQRKGTSAKRSNGCVYIYKPKKGETSKLNGMRVYIHTKERDTSKKSNGPARQRGCGLPLSPPLHLQLRSTYSWQDLARWCWSSCWWRWDCCPWLWRVVAGERSSWAVTWCDGGERGREGSECLRAG